MYIVPHGTCLEWSGEDIVLRPCPQSRDECEHFLCCHPNLLLSHGELILTWAFLPSLTHLRIAQRPGSGLKWHYFWLLMTSPKPAMQFKYPQECPGSISTRSDLVMGPGGGGCWVEHPFPGSSAVGLQHDVGTQVSRFSALSWASLACRIELSHCPHISLLTWLFGMAIFRAWVESAPAAFPNKTPSNKYKHCYSQNHLPQNCEIFRLAKSERRYRNMSKCKM